MGNLIIPGETALCGRLYKEWLRQQGIDGVPPESVNQPAVGLRNQRNMCFLNAIIQTLYFTPMLRRNLALALGSVPVKDEWLISLLQIFRELDESRSTGIPVVASRIAGLIQVASTNGEFQQGAQADAHEAFMVIISKLLSGCIAAKGLSFPEQEQMERSSLIGHVFGMSLGQSVCCQSCGHESTSTRAEYCLCITCPAPQASAPAAPSSREAVASPKAKASAKGVASPKAKASAKGAVTKNFPQAPKMLPSSLTRAFTKTQKSATSHSDKAKPGSSFPRSDVVAIDELLSNYTQGEEIQEWKCEKCEQEGCTRRAYVSERPNVLLIHVGRPSQDEAPPRVVFDAELDVSRYLESEESTQKRYSLFAVIVYRALGRGGHYFAFVRSGRGNGMQWNQVDDDEAKMVPWAAVQQEDPFMLIYEAPEIVSPMATEMELKLLKEQEQSKLRAEAAAAAAAAESKLEESSQKAIPGASLEASTAQDSGDVENREEEKCEGSQEEKLEADFSSKETLDAIAEEVAASQDMLEEIIPAPTHLVDEEMTTSLQPQEMSEAAARKMVRKKQHAAQQHHSSSWFFPSCRYMTEEAVEFSDSSEA